MENHYIQRGENDKYPKEITTWDLKETIPEWLIDKAKVKFVDGNGNVTLETKELTSGGFEIIDSTGTSILVKLENKMDKVCIDFNLKGPIFSLTENQLNLLYYKL